MKIPSILFNIHYLELGGAETALIGLLNLLDSKRVNVDLFINDPRGEMMKEIPEWVRIIPSPNPYRYIERPLKDLVKDGIIGIALGRIYAKFRYKIYCLRRKIKNSHVIFEFLNRYVNPFLPSLSYLGKYDVAIQFLASHRILLDKVDATKKIGWIHTDYSSRGPKLEIELSLWSKYDNIISISSDVTKSFLQVFPSLENKIIEIENFLPIEMIKRRSTEFIPTVYSKEDGILKLLSVGRYCDAKRFEDIPIIARILVEKNIKFRWYIIGYGSKEEETKIRTNIDRFLPPSGEHRGAVILLGKKENPYPYIKACDLYVQPSRYEGKSIAIREAQVLGKPVVITNYPTAKSQINDGIDGFIGPYETDPFANYLSDLILNRQDDIEKVKDNLKNMDFSQKEDLEKFYSLINGN